MRTVYVIGSYMTQFGKLEGKSVYDMAAEAVNGALTDAKITKEQIQSAYVSNCLWGCLEGQHGIRGAAMLRDLDIGGIPIFDVESACASGAVAFNGAWKEIQTGLYDCTLALGVEKMSGFPKEKLMASFNSFVELDKLDKVAEVNAKRMEKVLHQVTVPGVDASQKSRFMDGYALMALEHMAKYQCDDAEALAYIGAKNHNNGCLNPKAQYHFPMTPQQVKEDRMISWPITRSMCSPTSDGGAAAILCSEEYLRTLPEDVQARAVRVAAAEFRSGRLVPEGEPTTNQIIFKSAFETAGIQPSDLDVLEVHDGGAPGELKAYEEIGLCEPGKGAEYALSGKADIHGGACAVNPSGGLIARGHPVGATGLGQIYEIVTQLRGEAGERQVPNAKIGAAQNNGGSVGYHENDEGAGHCFNIFIKD